MTSVPTIEYEWQKEIHSFEDTSGTFHNVGNGCLHRNHTGYILLNRIQNWPTSLGRPPHKRHEQTISHIQVIHLDQNLSIQRTNILDQSLLYDRSFRPVQRQMIIGLEDSRLFTWKGSWYAICSTGHFCDWLGKGEFWGQALVRFNYNLTEIVDIKPLRYALRKPMEKNWLPFIQDDRLFVVYESRPWTILEIFEDASIAVRSYRPTISYPFRGGGSPIPWNDGWLFSIHEQGKIADESFDPPLDQYYYLHRFVEMDRNFNPTRISPLFCFREHGVEYSCGHVLSHDNQSLLIAYSSSNGTDSNLMSVSVETVEKMLDE